jgi:hypothetical protein
MLSMKHGFVTIFLSLIAAVVLVPIGGQVMHANAATPNQTGALVGYGGQIFGLVDVSSDGHQTEITGATNFLPPSGKVFEAWVVDGNYAASQYPLSLGQFSPAGKLKFDENMVNAYTFSDIVVTLEPENDKDPKPAWSQSIAAYWLSPPFGQ